MYTFFCEPVSLFIFGYVFNTLCLMKVFTSSIVFEKELALFLNCHRKTAKKYYQKILQFYKKKPFGLLTLAEVAAYYDLTVEDLLSFER